MATEGGTAQDGVRAGAGAHTPPARTTTGPVPLCKRQALSPRFPLLNPSSASNETFKIQESPLHTDIKQVSLSIYSLFIHFSKVK